jgi:hypothetical protein
MQFIDVRDLARFLIAPAPSGIFNVVAPSLPFAELLAAIGPSAEPFTSEEEQALLAGR